MKLYTVTFRPENKFREIPQHWIPLTLHCAITVCSQATCIVALRNEWKTKVFILGCNELVRTQSKNKVKTREDTNDHMVIAFRFEFDWFFD